MQHRNTCFKQASSALANTTDAEDLYKELLKEYTPAVNPGRIELKINVSILCAFIDKSTGFLTINAWESYVSNTIRHTRVSMNCIASSKLCKDRFLLTLL